MAITIVSCFSPVLSGEKSVDDIMLNTEQWYDDNGIKLRKGETQLAGDERPVSWRE